jgi:hypothetical protein
MMDGELEEDAISRPLSLLRLVIDPARVTQDVLKHEYPGTGTQEDPFIVKYLPHDVGNPQNWSPKVRWTISLIAANEMLAVAFASSAFSGV